jgi:hypothetical protein
MSNEPTNEANWLTKGARRRFLVCLTIPALERISGHADRHLNSNRGLAYANGYVSWYF